MIILQNLINYWPKLKLKIRQQTKYFLNKIVCRIKNSYSFRKVSIDTSYFFKNYACGNYFKRVSQIKKLRNIFSNQRCFILGSGPSLNKLNLEHLKKEYTIAVNQSFLITQDKYSFYPNTICLSDSKLYKKLNTLYSNLPSKIIFSTGIDGTIGRNYNSPNLAAIVRLNPFKLAWKAHFSADLVQGVCMSNNVITDLAIPTAIFMGFSKIYLIGCDFDQTGYAYDNLSGYTKTAQLILPEVFDSYISAKSYCDKKGIQIFNAGIGGRLEVFPRVDYDSLF